MIEYFRSIGFERLSNGQIGRLAEEVKRNPDRRYACGGDSWDTHWECFKYYGENIGVLVRGKIDENENETSAICMPVYLPEVKVQCAAASVENTGANYTVLYETGSSDSRMSFSLQNVVEYMKNRDLEIGGVSVAGLSLGGTILLPVAKPNGAEAAHIEERIFYNELLEKARTGNYLARQILNVKVQKTAHSIRRRLYREDILSIVEGFLMPSDKECSYFVMGNIVSMKMFKNLGTSDRIYRLGLSVAGVEIDVVVSGGSLVGMPMVGMRFLGGFWLQGRLNFE